MVSLEKKCLDKGFVQLRGLSGALFKRAKVDLLSDEITMQLVEIVSLIVGGYMTCTSRQTSEGADAGMIMLRKTREGLSQTEAESCTLSFNSNGEQARVEEYTASHETCRICVSDRETKRPGQLWNHVPLEKQTICIWKWVREIQTTWC